MAGDRAGGGTVIPVLPVDEVRAAIAADAWDRANALLQAHDRAVVAAVAGVDFSTQPQAPWRALLAAQQALADEVRAARDEVGRSLDKLHQDQRGARAWRQALA
ncbi:hypothetical protein [Luteimonas saliphila]|uniref:hypothetical protein n=1 Tax=Luteimonas saliphila TaxID=2804919 RepID=UPI001EE1839B|nr:hypothetical protein [Luteimonas saliphila]